MTMLGPDKGRRSASAMLTALLLPQGRIAFAADRIVIGRSIALSGPLEQLRIPAVGLTSGASDLRSPFKQFVFPVRASFSDEARRVVLHLKTIGVSRIAVAYTDNAFGQGVETTTLTATENAGIEALAVGMDPAGANAPTVSRRIQAAEPRVVVLAMANQAAVALVTQLRRASYHGAMYAFSAVDASIIGRQLGDEARGLAITRVVPPPNTIQVRVVAEYLSILKEFNAGAPSFFGLEGFLEAKVLIEGLRRAGTNPSPMALIAGLESMRDYDLGGFFVSYQSGQHTGSIFAEIDVINAAGGLTR